MEITDSSARTDSLIQMALQRQVLDSMNTQGAGLVQMIQSAPEPPLVGSINSASQGQFVDAWA
jgi:hypothetical protein